MRYFLAALAAFALITPVSGQPMLDDDPKRPVEAIARELGVTPEQFRAAFKKVRPAPRGQEPTEEQREQNRKILTEALGVSPERLDQVMDKYRPEGPNRRPPAPNKEAPPPPPPPARDGGMPVEAIAKELAVTPQKFRDAYKKIHPAEPGTPPTDAQRRSNRKILSEALGVAPERLDAVMDKYRPKAPPPPPPARRPD